MSEPTDKADKSESQRMEIRETIVVPDRDLGPHEMANIMRQVARICHFLGSLILREYSTNPSDRAAGAGHPICQNILNCAAQADAAAINLHQVTQVPIAIVRPGQGSLPARKQ